MNGYDIDFTRALGRHPRKRGAQAAVAVLLAAGILFLSAETAFRRDIAARKAQEAATLEARARAAAAPPESSRADAVVRARGERVLWGPLLGAVSEALPTGVRLGRIVFEEDTGVLRLDARPVGKAASEAFPSALDADTTFSRFFTGARCDSVGPDYVSIRCERRRLS
jgi:hypothetical protein